MGFLRLLLGWLSGGPLDRVLDTVDKRVEAQTDRDRIRGEIVHTYLQTRGDYMRAGGFVLMLLFAVPLAFWFALVIWDSAIGCADCMAPNSWTVAALPPPLDEWAGWIVISIFGAIGADRIGRKP